jgi:hypothetical protein
MPCVIFGFGPFVLRLGLTQVNEPFAEVEQLCLDGLMATQDAIEGRVASMERRRPS